MFEIALLFGQGFPLWSVHFLSPSPRVNLPKKLLPCKMVSLGSAFCPPAVPQLRQGTKPQGISPCSYYKDSFYVADLGRPSRLFSVPKCMSLHSPPSPSTHLFLGGVVQVLEEEGSHFWSSVWMSCSLKSKTHLVVYHSLPLGIGYLMPFALVVKVPPAPRNILFSLYFPHLVKFPTVEWKPRSDKIGRNLYCENSGC